MEEELLKKLEKKIILKGMIIFTFVGVIFGSIAGVAAYTYNAKDIEYTPSDRTWNVQNVSDAITSLKSGAPGSSVNYSEEEQVVGTWIDGKPLYQKVVSGTSGSKNTWNLLASIGINNTIVTCDLYLTDTAGFLLKDGFSKGAVIEVAANAGNNGDIKVYVGDVSMENRSVYAIIQYTKTTDEATN